MGSITTVYVLSQIDTITQDTKSRYWSESEKIEAINAAHREIVNQRPDACSEYYMHACEESATQTIPAHGIRFLEATHNQHNGWAISPMERSALDQVQRQWQNIANAEDTVEHYMYDDRFPKHFKVFPVPLAGTKIEVGISKAPEKVTKGGTITLDDIYTNAIIYLALAWLYQKNTTLTGSAQKAVQYQQMGFQTLGIKFQVDVAASPNNPQNRAD